MMASTHARQAFGLLANDVAIAATVEHYRAR